MEGSRLVISLLNFTVCLGLVNILVVYFLTRKVVTPVFFYWLAWFLGIGSAALCEYWGLLPPITEFGNSVIIQAHIGCFFGSIIASFLYVLMTKGIIKRGQNIPVWVNRLNLSSVQKHIWKVVLFMGIVSICHFLYRVSLLGSVDLPYIATTILSNMRYSFLFSDIGYTRYFNFLMSFTFVASTLLAVMIANNKIANKTVIISPDTTTTETIRNNTQSNICRFPNSHHITLCRFSDGHIDTINIRILPKTALIITPDNNSV